MNLKVVGQQLILFTFIICIMNSKQARTKDAKIDKQTLADELISSIKRSEESFVINFTAGYISSAINMRPSQKNINAIRKVLSSLFICTKKQQISVLNFVQIVVQICFKEKRGQGFISDVEFERIQREMVQLKEKLIQNKILLRQKWVKQAKEQPQKDEESPYQFSNIEKLNQRYLQGQKQLLRQGNFLPKNEQRQRQKSSRQIQKQRQLQRQKEKQKYKQKQKQRQRQRLRQKERQRQRQRQKKQRQLQKQRQKQRERMQWDKWQTMNSIKVENKVEEIKPGSLINSKKQGYREVETKKPWQKRKNFQSFQEVQQWQPNINSRSKNWKREKPKSIEVKITRKQKQYTDQEILRIAEQVENEQYQKSIKESIYLAKLLQQEENSHEKLLIQEKKMNCQICLEDMGLNEIGFLSCNHSFHIKCIRGHIQALINEKKLEIPCPSGCGANLSKEDIEDYIDGQIQQKYEKFLFDLFVQNSKSISWCPTPGCTAVFTFEQGIDNYKCLICNRNYCLGCKCQYHKGMSCAQYRINNTFTQEDEKFQQFIKGSKFKQCPKCQFWVQRSEGCSSMKCRCGHQFCYQCGGSDCPHGNCKKKLSASHFNIFQALRRRH